MLFLENLTDVADEAASHYLAFISGWLPNSMDEKTADLVLLGQALSEKLGSSWDETRLLIPCVQKFVPGLSDKQFEALCQAGESTRALMIGRQPRVGETDVIKIQALFDKRWLSGW